MAGKPRQFKTDKDFIDAILKYLDDCNKRERFPNVAGFCVYCRMHRDTFYAQKALYPDTYKIVQDILEDAVLNADVAPVQKIFYLKNKFGYVDKIESVQKTIEEPKHDLSKLTTEELEQYKVLAAKAERGDE